MEKVKKGKTCEKWKIFSLENLVKEKLFSLAKAVNKFNDLTISHLGLCNRFSRTWNAILSNIGKRDENVMKIFFIHIRAKEKREENWRKSKDFAQTCEILSVFATRRWLACCSELRKWSPEIDAERYFRDFHLRFSSRWARRANFR